MNESVESDALVIPSSTGLPCAGLPARFHHALVLFAELELIDHFFGQEFGVADIFDLHPAHHLPRDDFQVLIVDVDALQTIDFLDFVHQVLLQFLFAQHAPGCRADCADRPSEDRPDGRARLPAR